MYINQMKIKMKIRDRIMLIKKTFLKKSDLVVSFFKKFVIIKNYNDKQIVIIILISNMLVLFYLYFMNQKSNTIFF